MALTNLTGTTWKIPVLWWNREPSMAAELTFTTDSTTYSGPYNLFEWWNASSQGVLTYGSATVYQDPPGVWNDDNASVIHITGGSDVTKASVISWFETYTTQIADLPLIKEIALPSGETYAIEASALKDGTYENITAGAALPPEYLSMTGNAASMNSEFQITNNGTSDIDFTLIDGVMGTPRIITRVMDKLESGGGTPTSLVMEQPGVPFDKSFSINFQSNGDVTFNSMDTSSGMPKIAQNIMALLADTTVETWTFYDSMGIPHFKDVLIK